MWIFTAFPLLGGTWEMLYLCHPITWAVTGLTHFCYSRYVKRRILDRLSDSAEDSAPPTEEQSSEKDFHAVPDFEDNRNEDDIPVPADIKN